MLTKYMPCYLSIMMSCSTIWTFSKMPLPTLRKRMKTAPYKEKYENWWKIQNPNHFTNLEARQIAYSECLIHILEENPVQPGTEMWFRKLKNQEKICEIATCKRKSLPVNQYTLGRVNFRRKTRPPLNLTEMVQKMSQKIFGCIARRLVQRKWPFLETLWCKVLQSPHKSDYL